MTRSHPPRAPRLWARAVAAAVLTLSAASPVWAYLHTEPSPSARWVVAAMAAFGALFPAPALLLCAAFVPLSGPLSALLGASGAASLAEPLVLAFLAGWGMWLLATGLGPVSWSDPDGRTRLAVRTAIMPAAALAVVVAASAAVELFAIQPAVDDPVPFAAAAARYLHTDFFADRGRFDAIVSAAFVLEGIGLYAAAVILVGRDRRLAGRLFAMAAAGAAGVAALNVTRLVVVWQRSGGSLETLAGLWGSLRVSAVFGDPNAAGSYLGLALLLVSGLALGGRIWLPVLPIVAAALWLTGSRAALVSTVLAAVVLLPTAMRASRRLVWGTAIVVVLVVAASLPFAAGRFIPGEGSPRAVSQSYNFRVGMTRAAGRMIAEHPAFGIGVGMFLPRSSAYIGDGLRETVPRENAHNNFLQVLAELGVAGFVPFLAILALPARRVALAVRDGSLAAAGAGAAAGLLAFVLSWLSGHPLLIFEVSASFWLLLGAVTGQFSPHDGSAASARLVRRARVLGWATAAFAACIVVSVPFRGWAEEPRLGFTDSAIGATAWEEENGERFRTLEGRRGQVYVPADATSVRLPIRLSASAGGADWLDVEVRLDGVPLCLVRAEGRAWRDAAFMLPRTAARRSFRPVQVTVVDSSASARESDVRVQLGVPVITQPGAAREP
jgi:O-antigen ligase